MVCARVVCALCSQLWDLWNKVDPRYLTVKLVSAEGIPVMDDSGTTDAYCVAYLVPPQEPSEEARAEAEAVNVASGLADDPDDPELLHASASVSARPDVTPDGSPCRLPLVPTIPAVPPTPTNLAMEIALAPAAPDAPLPRARRLSMDAIATAKPAAGSISRPNKFSALAINTAAMQLRERRASRDSMGSMGSPITPLSPPSPYASPASSLPAPSPAGMGMAELISARLGQASGHEGDAAHATSNTAPRKLTGGGGEAVVHSTKGGGSDASTFRRRSDERWGRVRAKQKAAMLASAWRNSVTTWEAAREHVARGEWRAAVTVILRKASMVRASSFTQLAGMRAALTGGPVGIPGQYAKTYSRVCPKTLSPRWSQYLELRLEGGELDQETGEYDNQHAPYTQLRLELWDRDRLSRDDFIGEVYVRLCPLMDARVHEYELPLVDPEGKCGADGGVTGSIKFTLQYES